MRDIKYDDIIPGTKNFKWHDALWLPSWNRYAGEIDGVTDENLDNLIAVFGKLQAIRDTLNSPIIVHVAIRPAAYNAQIGGAKSSCHIPGMAIDFHATRFDCDEVRRILVEDGWLEKLGIRCEDAEGTNWVHIDVLEIKSGGHAYFKP